MKKLFLTLLIATGITATAQVKIGANPTTLTSPESTTLELESTKGALLITRVAVLDSVRVPVNGMIVYDLSSNCFKGFQNGRWSLCGFQAGAASSNGSGVIDSFANSIPPNRTGGTITVGVAIPAGSVTETVTATYTGAAGGTYAINLIANGISFTGSGILGNSPHQIELTASGTPTAMGTHTFTSNTTPAFSFTRTTTSAAGRIPGNELCGEAPISVKSCAGNGAAIDDDVNTTGTEYTWIPGGSTALGTGFGAPNNGTRSLIEINGQCWAKYNSNVVNTNNAAFVADQDNGNSSEYQSGSALTDGLLYQWSGAMNGATAERAKGVCPNDWHIPSDCEWMFLENSLGMNNVTEQQNSGWRNDGAVGSKLYTSSGFAALLSGFRTPGGTFSDRTASVYWWSSSASGASIAFNRGLYTSFVGVNRQPDHKGYSFSVRCLKD